MMKNIKDFTKSMKSIGELRKLMGDVDMSDPEKMMESMGIDMEDLNKTFIEAHNKKLELKYTYESDNKEPSYAYGSDSGFDLRTNIDLEIMPFGRYLVPTGVFLDIPEGMKFKLDPKVGWQLKKVYQSLTHLVLWTKVIQVRLKLFLLI